MFKEFQKHIPILELVLGAAVYVLLLFSCSFSLCIVWAIFVLYGWIFTSIALKQLDLKKTINVLSCFGVIVSITLFFLYAVERAPYPEGAILFNINYVATSLFILFISTMPLIFIQKNKINYFLSNPTSIPIDKKTFYKKNEDENWEEATLEDVRSNEFEAI